MKQQTPTLSGQPAIDLLICLREHGVQFVVTGASAAALRGHQVDFPSPALCYQQTWTNCECLARALEEMEAELDPPSDFAAPITGLLRQASEPVRFTTVLGDLELQSRVPGLGGYEEVWPESTTASLPGDGLRVRALSIEQLVRWLQISGGGHQQADLLASLCSSSALRFSIPKHD